MSTIQYIMCYIYRRIHSIDYYMALRRATTIPSTTCDFFRQTVAVKIFWTVGAGLSGLL